MAGSRTRKKYESDDGNTYTIVVDESNAEATKQGSTVALCAPVDNNYQALPRSTKTRFVLAYLASNPSIRRKFRVGDRTLVLSLLEPGAQLSAVVYPNSGDSAGDRELWNITAYRGEKAAVEPSVAGSQDDTGLEDGDENFLPV